MRDTLGLINYHEKLVVIAKWQVGITLRYRQGFNSRYWFGNF